MDKSSQGSALTIESTLSLLCFNPRKKVESYLLAPFTLDIIGTTWIVDILAVLVGKFFVHIPFLSSYTFAAKGSVLKKCENKHN